MSSLGEPLAQQIATRLVSLATLVGRERKTKQWVITPTDGKPIAIAVITSKKWTKGAETLDTFIQVTTPANALIPTVTDRMPAILPEADWATWLGETDASPADVKAVLRTFKDEGAWMMVEQSTREEA